MASIVYPVRATALVFEIEVFDNTGKLLTAATFSSSTISKDGGSFNPMSNAPVEIGVTGVYTISVTASEMTADRVKGKFVISGAPDITFTIYTVLRRIDDLAFGNVSGRGIDIESTGEVGINLDNIKQASAPTTLTNLTIPTVTLVDTVTDVTNDPVGDAIVIALADALSDITTETGIIKAKTNNLPSSPAATGDEMDLVDAPNAISVAAIQSGLATQALLTTVSNKLGGWAASGRNTVLGAFQAIFRKDSDASVPTDINTNLGSGAGAASNVTDSLEAIRDRGDVAWTGGGAAPTVIEIRQEIDSNSTQLAAVKAKTDPLTYTVSNKVDANVINISGDATAADNAESFFDGTGYAGTNNVMPVVTTLTNVPNGVNTLLTRLSDARAGYLDAFAGFTGTIITAIQSLARKNVSSADIGGTYNAATDSLEATREKIDDLASVTPTTENVTINELDT